MMGKFNYALIEERVSEIVKDMNDISSDFVFDYYDRDSTEYLCDMVSQCADSNVDLYYSDLKEWIQNDEDAVDMIDESVSEYGIDTNNFDFMQMLQSAQYYQNEKRLQEDMDDIIECFYLMFLDDVADGHGVDVTRELIENVIDNIDWRNNDCMDIILSSVEEFLDEYIEGLSDEE